MKILNKIAESFCLNFTKEHKLQVVVQLLVNSLYYCKLRITKFRCKNKGPIIHLYAACWNEEKLLPFMFNHYDSIVSQYFIFDNGSTDKSCSIVVGKKNAVLKKYSSDGIDDKALTEFKNSCWKASRGKADYVIVCDIDEFLYFPDFSKLFDSGASLFHPQGYNMISDSFPTSCSSLVRHIRSGVRTDFFSKTVMFDPYRIAEINYCPGAHSCRPEGIIREYNDPRLKLLHYKYLSLSYILMKTHSYQSRLSEYNKVHGYGWEYRNSDETSEKDFQSLLLSASEVLLDEGNRI